MQSAEWEVQGAECKMRSVENEERRKCGVWKIRSVENEHLAIITSSPIS